MKEKVEVLLKKYPHLRDNDNALVANIWWTGVDLKNKTATELLRMLSNKELPNIEAITRARRKLQEENPELRGNTYKGRKEEEQDVRKNMNKMEHPSG